MHPLKMILQEKTAPSNGLCPRPRILERGRRVFILGYALPTTPIAASDVNASYAHENFALGVKVAKFFTHTFGAQVEYIYGQVEGQNRVVSIYGFTTTIKADFTINMIAHIGNIRFLSRTPNLGIYATAGVGLIYFNPINDSAGIVRPWNYFVNSSNGPPQPADYHNTTEYIVPIGLGVRYLVSDKISINVDYSFRQLNSYKLAGWWRIFDETDTYTYASLGVTYHFGKQKEIIEWTNPMDALYNSFYSQLNYMKKSIDSLKMDTDGDGVADYFDKDNNTPKGFMVYGNGTAVDFDGDGVPDAIDFCPTIPGPASNHGCPVTVVEQVQTKKQQEVEKTPISNEEQEIISQVFKNLQFETGKSIIRESSFISLNELANLLKKKPAYKLLIEGHTDNVGGAAANMKLSTDRSNAVKKYLVDKGIDESRLIAKAYGLTKPIADNKTPEGRQMNRRVDFTIVQ